MFSFQVRRPSWNAGEWEARRAAARVARGETVPELQAGPEEAGPLPSHAQEALGSPGQPLDARTRADFEARFGHDFSRVRVHDDAGAARSAAELRARAYTFGQDIVFGSGRYQPGSTAGRSLIAHELAHVVQQGRAGRAALQLDSELDSFPKEERTKVQVLTATLDKTGREDVESAYLAAGSPKLPAGMKVQFGTSVSKKSREGLQAVVGTLVDGKDLPSNTSMTLAITAAKGVYRFTRVERTAKSKTTETVIVEKTGKLGAASAPAAEDTAVLDEKEVEVRTVKMKRGPGWQPGDWGAVSAALENLPETVLKRARGVTFLREKEKTCTGEQVKAGCNTGTEAETSLLYGTITLFDRVFEESTTRQGAFTRLESTLIHEIGHLADGVFLGNAMSDYLQSGKSAEDRKKLDEARSLSGLGWTQGDKGLFRFEDAGEVPAEDSFRAAAIKDGLVLKDGKIVSGGVTSYGQTGWDELFAECYMLYFADPDFFKAIRPNLYKFFDSAWPRKKKKKK